jgi:hypothetical protein
MDDHYIADVREAMVGLFKRVGTQVGEVVASRGRPGPGVLEQCVALGRALAKTVLR